MTIIVSPKGVRLSQLMSKTEDTGTYVYTGFADSGSADTDTVWAIMRETKADGTVLWKTGPSGGFSNSWTARASGTYE